jgi:hypothetical protein
MSERTLIIYPLYFIFYILNSILLSIFFCFKLNILFFVLNKYFVIRDSWLTIVYTLLNFI